MKLLAKSHEVLKVNGIVFASRGGESTLIRRRLIIRPLTAFYSTFITFISRLLILNGKFPVVYHLTENLQ